jgi:hypothetical protein
LFEKCQPLKTLSEDYKKQRLSNEQNVPIEDELETSLYRLGEGDRKVTI